MIDAVGEARDELDRILQVIKHPTRHTDIEVRLITLQIRYSITTQKLDTPELQDFLDDQTLQKGPVLASTATICAAPACSSM
jgi:hypothetical protein